MRIVILILITVHALIHVTGFVKAFDIAEVNEIQQGVSDLNGILWLLSAIFFLISATLRFLKKDQWWIISVPAILISQYLIFTSWQDAKFGTIVNVILLTAVAAGFGKWNFNSKYKNDVKEYINLSASGSHTLLTEADILTLPEPVKKYLHYTGVMNKAKVRDFKAEFEGQIRKNEQSEWMKFTSEQYNFINSAIRLFFMKAIMKHLPVSGYHCFKNGKAFMDIRLLSLFRVQYQKGSEMDLSETVTFFNDMCCLAPATLTDNRIKWIEEDENTVYAEFTNNGNTISARLYFSETGELINFVSEDRYALLENDKMEKLRWSTPLKDYKIINGVRLAGFAETIYSYPGGDLCYGCFKLTNIEYNI